MVSKILWSVSYRLFFFFHIAYLIFFFLFLLENLVSGLHLNDSLGKHYISLLPKHFMKVLDPVILETVRFY